jgi:hypothetical protein
LVPYSWGNPTKVTPKLTLKFSADRAYNSVAFEFLLDNSRTDSRCGVDFNGVNSDNVRASSFHGHIADGVELNGAWSYTGFGGASTCGDKATFQYEVNDYNNALTNCGWKIDESSTGVTTMKTTVLMTTLEQGVIIRNVLYKKTLESAVQLGIEFQTNVTATTGNLTIFGPVIQYSTLLKQTFEPVNSCANWLLLTSVQGPYQLFPTVGSGTLPGATGITVSGNPASWTGVTYNAFSSNNVASLAVTGYSIFDSDAKDNANNDHANLAKCVTNALDTESDFTRNNSATEPYPPCNQYWYLRACKACDGTFTDNENLNYDWSATFTVVCHHTFSGACTTPQTNQVTVSWSTSSDNYCPRIIDTESSSATLSVYQTTSDTGATVKALPIGGATFSGPQSQFVFGTYSFFEAITTSTIKIDDLEIERITLTAGGASSLSNGVVFARPAFTGANWFIQDLNQYASNVSGSIQNNLALDAPNLGANFAINKNVTFSAGASDDPLQRKCQFQWIWGSPISAASGDFPISTTVQVDLRVRYSNQNTPKYLVLSTKYIPNLQVDTGATATRTVGVQGSTGTTTPVGGGASAEGSAALSTGTIAIGAAAVGGVALIAAATVVAVRRRRKSAEVDTNIESIQLGGGSSQAQLNTV